MVSKARKRFKKKNHFEFQDYLKALLPRRESYSFFLFNPLAGTPTYFTRGIVNSTLDDTWREKLSLPRPGSLSWSKRNETTRYILHWAQLHTHYRYSIDLHTHMHTFPSLIIFNFFFLLLPRKKRKWKSNIIKTSFLKLVSGSLARNERKLLKKYTPPLKTTHSPGLYSSLFSLPLSGRQKNTQGILFLVAPPLAFHSTYHSHRIICMCAHVK